MSHSFSSTVSCDLLCELLVIMEGAVPLPPAANEAATFAPTAKVWYRCSTGEEIKGRVVKCDGGATLDLNVRDGAARANVRARSDDAGDASDEGAYDRLWAVGQRVWYTSTSSGQMMKARITAVGATLDLNVKEDADEANVKPRGDDDASDPDQYDYLVRDWPSLCVHVCACVCFDFELEVSVVAR
jgi:hypothetical protein